MMLTCPNCGTRVPDQIGLVTMMTCASCDTTLFLDGANLRAAGQSGEMHDSPTLFGLGDTVKLGRNRVTIMGHARYSYGRGWWDEFWGTDQREKGLWISVDEGDIVVQRPLEKALGVPTGAKVGTAFEYDHEHFRVVETGEAECVAIRGAFGETLLVGERYRYLNAQGDDGSLISAEVAPDGTTWFIGRWHDPFEISVKVIS